MFMFIAISIYRYLGSYLPYASSMLPVHVYYSSRYRYGIIVLQYHCKIILNIAILQYRYW